MKTEPELRAKLTEMLALDGRDWPEGMVFSKVAACKALLWALGENDDDHWFIAGAPGPAVDRRAMARN